MKNLYKKVAFEYMRRKRSSSINEAVEYLRDALLKENPDTEEVLSLLEEHSFNYVLMNYILGNRPHFLKEILVHSFIFDTNSKEVIEGLSKAGLEPDSYFGMNFLDRLWKLMGLNYAEMQINPNLARRVRTKQDRDNNTLFVKFLDNTALTSYKILRALPEAGVRDGFAKAMIIAYDPDTLEIIFQFSMIYTTPSGDPIGSGKAEVRHSVERSTLLGTAEAMRDGLEEVLGTLFE